MPKDISITTPIVRNDFNRVFISERRQVFSPDGISILVVGWQFAEWDGTDLKPVANTGGQLRFDNSVIAALDAVVTEDDETLGAAIDRVLTGHIITTLVANGDIDDGSPV